MKKTLFTLAAAAMSVVAAQATVEITITGATAFRGDAYNAIRAMFDGGVPASQNPAHSASGQNKVTFSGLMTPLFGAETVIVRTSYSGSADGVKAVDGTETRNFLFSSTAGAPLTTNMICDFAFSDVFQSSTDFQTQALEEAEVVPGKSGIAVIPFVWTKGNSCSSKVTNITGQVARAMTGIGFVPLFMLTGDPADLVSTEIVNLVGRDNGSGTRICTLAEISLGILPNIAQRRAIAGNWTDDATGLSSGSIVATNLNGTATSLDGPGGAVSYLAPNDSATTVTGGGKALTYDGVVYSKDNVRNGKYTLWGFEHLYNAPGMTGSGSKEETFRTAFALAIDAIIPSLNNAIAIGTMNVTRLADGAVVTP